MSWKVIAWWFLSQAAAVTTMDKRYARPHSVVISQVRVVMSEIDYSKFRRERRCKTPAVDVNRLPELVRRKSWV